MNLCFFIGAGFSKGIFDQKIQSEFAEDFLNSNESEDYSKYLPQSFKNRLLKENNIEKIMTEYLNAAYPNSENEIFHNNYKLDLIYFRQAMAIYYRNKFSIKGMEFYKDKRDDVTSFVNSIKSNKLSFLTTNFDLGLEIILNEVLGERSFYYAGIDNEYNVNESKIPLVKLHGSINWMEDRGSYLKDAFFDPSRSHPYPLNILEKLQIVAINSENGFKLVYKNRKYTPIISPFFENKEEWLEINKKWWTKLFKEISSKTKECLKKADKIFFWGYSLPAADESIKQLIENHSNREAKFIIVDVHDNTRLINLLKSIVNNKKIEINKISIDKYFEKYKE